jgi:hypothetical protein
MKKVLILSLLLLLLSCSISYADGFMFSFREGGNIYTFHHNDRNYMQRQIIIVSAYPAPVFGYPAPYYNYYGYPPINRPDHR